MDFKDYYKTLGVPSNGSLEIIRTAYRKLSKKFHPDVNNGDKFFEEKFKEIQEAYEILSDTSKRKQYDYKRAQFRKSSTSDNQAHEDSLRKKEEEFRRQKEDFDKWEESLRRKEEILKEKESQKAKETKKPFYTVLILLFVSIAFSLIYFSFDRKLTNPLKSTFNNESTDTTELNNNNSANDNFKQSSISTKLLNGKTYKQDSKGDWYEIQTPFEENNNLSKKEVLNREFRNSKLAKILEGDWKGSAFQYDLKESWTIKFTCDLKEGTFLIEYPSLGCRGNLSIENITNDEIEFRENIQEGNCINNGKIRLKILGNKKLVYLGYFPNSNDIIAKGQVIKN